MVDGNSTLVNSIQFSKNRTRIGKGNKANICVVELFYYKGSLSSIKRQTALIKVVFHVST